MVAQLRSPAAELAAAELRRCGALSNDQLGDEFDPGDRHGDPLGEVEQHPGRRAGHDLDVLVDRREWGAAPLGHRDVVISHDGHVGGHLQAELPGGSDDPHRLHVGPGENSGRAVGPAEQLQSVLVAGMAGELPVTHQPVVNRDAGLVVGRAETGHSGPAAQHVLGTGDHRDPMVPELQQVLGGQQAAVEIVGAYRRYRRGGRAVGVQHHERELSPLQLLALGLGEVA